jgi:hypothetical protein
MSKYVPLTAADIANLTKVLITTDGKGTSEKSSALSTLMLDCYNIGKAESETEISKLSKKLKDVWRILSSILTGMLISDPRWKEAAHWLNDNRP